MRSVMLAYSTWGLGFARFFTGKYYLTNHEIIFSLNNFIINRFDAFQSLKRNMYGDFSIRRFYCK